MVGGGREVAAVGVGGKQVGGNVGKWQRRVSVVAGRGGGEVVVVAVGSGTVVVGRQGGVAVVLGGNKVAAGWEHGSRAGGDPEWGSWSAEPVPVGAQGLPGSIVQGSHAVSRFST